MNNIRFKIEGMHCEGCSNRLTKVLNSLDGIVNASVSLEKKEANIEFDETKVSIKEIKEVIEDAGFQAMEG